MSLPNNRIGREKLLNTDLSPLTHTSLDAPHLFNLKVWGEPKYFALDGGLFLQVMRSIRLRLVK